MYMYCIFLHPNTYVYIHIMDTFDFQFPPFSHLQRFKKQDFDKKLSHVNRGASSTKPVDGAGGAAGLDTMAEANRRDGWIERTNGESQVVERCMMTISSSYTVYMFMMSFVQQSLYI